MNKKDKARIGICLYEFLILSTDLVEFFFINKGAA